MTRIEERRIKEYCKDNGYNQGVLATLRENRLERYDVVLFSKPCDEAISKSLRGLIDDAAGMPKVVFEYIISTGDIKERPWTKEIMTI